MKKFIVILAFLVISCTKNYSISHYYPTDHSNPKLNGSLSISNFSYQPAYLGIVQIDQLEGSPPIRIGSSIADLVRNATKTELDRSGIKIDDGDLILTGRIKEFSREYVHFPHFIMNFKYLISYKITNKKTNTTLLERDYFVLYHANQDDFFNNPALYISKIIYSGYEKFAKDTDVVQILNNN